MKAYRSLLVLSVIACASAASMNNLHAVQHQSSFDAESQKLDCKWIGTAPFCGGSSADCQGSTPNYFVWSTCGDGAACSSGYKVLCCSHENQYSLLYWMGTGPFCGGQCSDCQSDYCVGNSFCGDGAVCWAGLKVLCARRSTVTTAKVEELQKISAYTRDKEEAGYKKAQLMGGVHLKQPMEPYPDLALAYVNYDMVIEDN